MMTIRELPKKERHAAILKRAEEMADSGKYVDYMLIEIALRHEGFTEARTLLDDSSLRKELNERCKLACEQNKQNDSE